MKSWQIDYTLQQVVQVNDFPLQDHSAKRDTINEHVEMFNPHVPVFYAKWDIVETFEEERFRVTLGVK